MNKTLVAVVGCLAVLLLVCCVGVAAFLVLGQSQNLLAQFVPAGALRNLNGGPDIVPTTAPSTKVPFAPNQPSQTKTAPTTTASSGNPFADALSKAQNAKKFRVEFSFIIGSTQNGKYTEAPLADCKGEVDGQNSHLTDKNAFLSMMGGSGGTPIEVIEADGKTYTKGVNLFGQTDPKAWYISQDSMSMCGEFTQVDGYKDWVGGTQPGDVKKVRSEQLDGQSCDVYLYDMKSVQNAALFGLLGSASDQTDFSAVEKGDINFWLCGDGFVHKFALDYEGHDSKDATQKGALKMNWHVWDFNNAGISVTAPKDAKPMPGS